jgi:hypothetical protein
MGRAISADVVREKINHPSNAFNAESNAHESFDQLAWGIQAVQQPGGEVSHIIFYKILPYEFSLNSTNTSTVWSAMGMQLQ